MEYRKYLKNLPLYELPDQRKGLPVPPLEKPFPEDAELTDLIPFEKLTSGKEVSVIEAIVNRESKRKFKDKSLTLEELSYLLWCTQGIKKYARDGMVTLRTVPSGGAMHPYETYLAITNIEGIEPGLYRYIATKHKLLFEKKLNPKEMPEKIGEICRGQTFIGKAPVIFFWSARPYRTEYRYGEDSLKDILMGVGHICQNLYIACEAISAGTCAIVAYKQELLDEFLNLDGNDEISLYLAPVGKI